MKFKKGDRVRYFHSKNSKYSKSYLRTSIHGNIYTVKGYVTQYSYKPYVLVEETIFGDYEECFELVKEEKKAMRELKVGDKVRVRAGASTSSKRLDGQICTVAKINLEARCATLEEEGYPADRGGVHLVDLTLVEEDISELIKKANEGYVAAQALRDLHSSEVEFSHSGGDWNDPRYLPAVVDSRVRLKQKTFEPFTVGSNWMVSLKDSTLTIGCQSFDATPFRQAIEIAEEGGKCTLPLYLNGHPLQAIRNGVQWNGYKLSWTEVDQIVKALREARV